MPLLLPDNATLFQVYNLVANQVIVAGMGEILDLNICAVEIAFSRFEIPEKLKTKYLLRLMSMFRTRLAERREGDPDG